MLKTQLNLRYVEALTNKPQSGVTPTGQSVVAFPDLPDLAGRYITNIYTFFGNDSKDADADSVLSPISQVRLLSMRQFSTCFLRMQDDNGFIFHDKIPLGNYAQVITPYGGSINIHKTIEVDYIPRKVNFSKCEVIISNQLMWDFSKQWAIPMYVAYMEPEEYLQYHANHAGHLPKDHISRAQHKLPPHKK